MRYMVAILAVFSCLLVSACQREVRVTPNILLISIDSLRSDHLGSYGYFRDTSPNIDQVAAEGARFVTAIAPAPWTLPSHVTMLTGRHPAAHGVSKEDRRLAEEIPTLAEVLQARGYATAGFVAGPYLRSDYGYARGFDLYDESLVEDGKAAHTGTTSPQLIEKVIDWLAGEGSAPPPRPFFAFLHLWDVHYDFSPPPPFDTMFDPTYEGVVDGTEIGLLTPSIAKRDLEHVVALYDGEIRFTDQALGVLLAKLREVGLWENTVVVITADHGEEFFEHGKIGHLFHIFDEAIQVPLIVHYPPEIEPGLVLEEQVRLMDIAPTILGLVEVESKALGMPAGAPEQDRDLSPWLRGDLFAGRVPQLVSFPENYGGGRVGVRMNEGKLIRHNRDYYELYNVRPEAGELEKETGKSPEVIAVLAELIEREAAWNEWREEGEVTAPAMDMPESLQRQLEALGYIDR
jgi:arylsulfatase A-like enzyme